MSTMTTTDLIEAIASKYNTKVNEQGHINFNHVQVFNNGDDKEPTYKSHGKTLTAEQAAKAMSAETSEHNNTDSISAFGL